METDKASNNLQFNAENLAINSFQSLLYCLGGGEKKNAYAFLSFFLSIFMPNFKAFHNNILHRLFQSQIFKRKIRNLSIFFSFFKRSKYLK